MEWWLLLGVVLLVLLGVSTVRFDYWLNWHERVDRKLHPHDHDPARPPGP